MDTRTEKVGNELVLSPEGEIGIAEAGRLRDELLAAFGRSKRVAVDLAQTEDLDTAAIQLLCAAEQTARKRKKTFAVRNMPDGVLRSVALLGLDGAPPFAAGGEEVRS